MGGKGLVPHQGGLGGNVGYNAKLRSRRLLGELARYMRDQLFGVPGELCLQVNTTFVGQHNDRPQAVG